MAQSYRLTGPQGYRSRITLASPATNISRRTGKTPAFILDLDQTIWDTTDEAKAIEEDLIFRLKPQKGFLEASDWTAWTKAAQDVEPIDEMVSFVRGLQESGLKPVIMTARDRRNEPMIRSTLKKYGISADHIMTRGLSQAQQDMPSDLLKVKMMEKTSNRFNFLAMLDDSGANLKGAHGFGVPLTIQPEKKAFDSLEASITRGLHIASSIDTRTLQRAERTVEPVVRMGVQGEKTASRIIEGLAQAMRVMGKSV